MDGDIKCPVMHTAFGGRSNRDWWPNQLNLKLLAQNSEKSDPMGTGFSYAAEFGKLALAALKADVTALMTASQHWGPEEYGNFGGRFIRTARLE
ncbi:MAG: hypothetical protein AB3N23_09990 [Paracoccaceae bacterium]